MDINKEKSDIGIKVVMEYLLKQGYSDVKDVSLIKEHKGYDIIAKKDDCNIKIEVKCSAKDKGIPDCFGSEFDSDRKIKADFFYIVRIDESKKPYRIDILSKDEFDKYSNKHTLKQIIKVSSKLKTDLGKNKIGKTINLDY